MSATRPTRFGANYKDDVAVGAEVADAPVDATVDAVDFATEEIVDPTPIRAAAKPKPKKPAPKRTVAPKEADEFMRKHVEWVEEIDFEFQDGCDTWYVQDIERKRRLRRRPTDNQFITGLVRLALKALENDKTVTVTLPDGTRKTGTYGEILEDLMPPPRTGR